MVLLETLEDVTREIHGEGPTGPIGRVARFALDQAEGRTPRPL